MRNAFSGYTYQQQVTLLFLSIMDVERKISKIDIEAKVENNFDDLIITKNSQKFQIQIKDFNEVKVKDLRIINDNILINRKPHKLSKTYNIIIFRKISIVPNGKVLGFKGFEIDKNVWVISLSRTQIEENINKIYKNNPQRKNEIAYYFNSALDKRIWEIKRDSLPTLKVFITKLQEKSVLISQKLLKFEKLLLIEGKPGVGKSHFVNTLIENYKNNIVYRFWIGSQDNDYQDRLIFHNFIRDLNAKLFFDQKNRPIDDILNKLKIEEKTLIIDGLDHVLNYNNQDFYYFIEFIEKVKDFCNTIVLSRPLNIKLSWKKHILENWNLNQTKKILNEIFHLTEYSITTQIYNITQGYPIVVRYIAEHYKINKTIPQISQVESINSYYLSIMSDELGKQSLCVFLCSKSFLMESEIGLFIGDEKYYVEEFIREHPYLFEVKLNRISLFHDSFNTFLKLHVRYLHKVEMINQIVFDSIIKTEKKFLSRFSSFSLSKVQKKKILVNYSSIKKFEKLIHNTVDFEALQSFYIQLRETLRELTPSVLSVKKYYDLSLILNLLSRDHTSTLNRFNYSYLSSLIANGFTDEDITSSNYLFGMYYYIKTNNATILYNVTTSDSYGTDYFYAELENDVYEEESHLDQHSTKLSRSDLNKDFADKINFNQNVEYAIENIFINKYTINGFEPLKTSMEYYIDGRFEKAYMELHSLLHQYGARRFHSQWILDGAYKNLLSYGYKIDNGKNDFVSLSIAELLLKYRNVGSFELRKKLHNHIRLALLNNIQTDIKSIYKFWTKFYERKDPTMYSLPIAIQVIEQNKQFSLLEGVNLIIKVQGNSEKGNRHLLSEFIELYPPSKIIPLIERNFDLEELQIEWFKLKPKYINQLSEQTYYYEERKLLEYHSNLSFSLEEIKNVLSSNKLQRIKYAFDCLNAHVTYKDDELKIMQQFNETGLIFSRLEVHNEKTPFKQSSKERFDDGILTYRDIRFIKKKNFKPYDIAKYADGNYMSLSDMKIYELYPSHEIKKYLPKILYYSLTSKTESINYFYSLYMHPGNILAMIKKYRSQKEFDLAIISFEKFMKLSSFNLNLK